MLPSTTRRLNLGQAQIDLNFDTPEEVSRLFNKPEMLSTNAPPAHLKKLIEQYELIKTTLNTPAEIKSFNSAIISFWFKKHVNQNYEYEAKQDKELKKILANTRLDLGINRSSFFKLFVELCTKRSCCSSNDVRFSSKFIAYLFLNHYSSKMSIDKIEFSSFLWQNISKGVGLPANFVKVIGGIWKYIQHMQKTSEGNIKLSRNSVSAPSNTIMKMNTLNLINQYYAYQDQQMLANQKSLPQSYHNQNLEIANSYLKNILNKFTNIKNLANVSKFISKIDYLENMQCYADFILILQELQKQFNLFGNIIINTELLEKLNLNTEKIKKLTYLFPVSKIALVEAYICFSVLIKKINAHIASLSDCVNLDHEKYTHKKIFEYQQRQELENEFDESVVKLILFVENEYEKPDQRFAFSTYKGKLKEDYMFYQRTKGEIALLLPLAIEPAYLISFKYYKDILFFSESFINKNKTCTAIEIVEFIQENSLFRQANLYFIKDPISLVIKSPLGITHIRLPIPMLISEFIQNLHFASDSKLTDSTNGTYMLKPKQETFSDRRLNFLNVATGKIREIVWQKYFPRDIRSFTARKHNDIFEAISDESKSDLIMFKSARLPFDNLTIEQIYQIMYTYKYTACYELARIALDLIAKENILAPGYTGYMMELDNRKPRNENQNHDHVFIGICDKKNSLDKSLEDNLGNLIEGNLIAVIDLWAANIFIGSLEEYINYLQANVDNLYVKSGVKKTDIILSAYHEK